MFHEVGYGTSQDELFTLEPTIFGSIAPDDNQEFGSYINVLYFLESLFVTAGYGIL